MLFCVTKIKLDAGVAACEDKIIDETPDSDTAQDFTCITAPLQVANHCFLEDDLDDIAAFPVFNKRSSRRLRRTSVEIYRKSLRDAENVASEEECDANPVNTGSDTVATDVEMHLVSGEVFCNKPALFASESDDSQISSINSNSTVQPEIGNVYHLI